MESRGRIENVQELKSNILGFLEQDPEDATLSGFLNEIALYTDLDSVEAGDDCVTMMTIHSAKGLEVPVVYVVGMEEGIFPGTASMYDEEELEEERRLFYVAVTRAKTRLYLSSYAAKPEGFPVRPSAFIQDIDYNLLECVGNVVQNGQTTPQMLPKKTFDVGDKVEHKIFGVGTIVDINLSTQSYEIDFEKLTGTRKIMFRAELKKV